MPSNISDLHTLLNQKVVSGGSPLTTALSLREFLSEFIDSSVNNTESALQQLSGQLDMQSNAFQNVPNFTETAVEMFAISPLTTQGPSAVDTIHQVSFGPAQTGPGPGAVTVDANGTFTFPEPGLYWQLTFLNFTKVGGGSPANIYLRQTINGVNIGDPTFLYLRDAGNNLEFNFTAPITISTPNSTLAVEFFRDSGGSNDGVLQAYTPTDAGLAAAWGTSTCARMIFVRTKLANP